MELLVLDRIGHLQCSMSMRTRDQSLAGLGSLGFVEKSGKQYNDYTRKRAKEKMSWTYLKLAMCSQGPDFNAPNPSPDDEKDLEQGVSADQESNGGRSTPTFPPPNQCDPRQRGYGRVEIRNGNNACGHGCIPTRADGHQWKFGGIETGERGLETGECRATRRNRPATNPRIRTESTS